MRQGIAIWAPHDAHFPDNACADFTFTRQRIGVLSLVLEDSPFIGVVECEVSARDRNQFFPEMFMNDDSQEENIYY